MVSEPEQDGFRLVQLLLKDLRTVLDVAEVMKDSRAWALPCLTFVSCTYHQKKLAGICEAVVCVKRIQPEELYHRKVELYHHISCHAFVS